jgi:hypothetical protein
MFHRRMSSIESGTGAEKGMAMMIDRTGKWAWALTPAERLVAVSVSVARQEGTPIGPKLAHHYEIMRIKQTKLLDRGVQPGGIRGFAHASRRAATAPAASSDGAPGPAALPGAMQEGEGDGPVD